MPQDTGTKKEYAGYEYKTIQIKEEKYSFYLDSYQCFGWVQDENSSASLSDGQKSIKLKRNRKIVNKMEQGGQQEIAPFAHDIGEPHA